MKLRDVRVSDSKPGYPEVAPASTDAGPSRKRGPTMYLDGQYMAKVPELGTCKAGDFIMLQVVAKVRRKTESDPKSKEPYNGDSMELEIHRLGVDPTVAGDVKASAFADDEDGDAVEDEDIG